MKIKKTSETTPKVSQTVNTYSESTQDSYSCDYINEQNTYSTTEQRIGTWINGKPLYRKVVNYGALPNATTKDVAHNVNDADKIWIAGGFADYINDSNVFIFCNQLSLNTPANANQGWFFGVDKSIIKCQTTIDRSYYKAYVILNYTKTTD